LWESVLVEWERFNILDWSGDVFTCPLKLIKKLAFGCLANLKEKQLEKLARGLFDHTIMLRECPAKGGGRVDLKSMYEITRVLKQKSVICNESCFISDFRNSLQIIRSPTRMTSGRK
jgi:hypothetical protein